MRSIIFDLDGVLVNSEPIYRKAWKRAYKEIGIYIDDELHDRVISGNHPMVSTMKVLNIFGKKINNRIQEKLNKKKEEISCQIIDRDGICPHLGVTKLVSELHKRGYPLSLVSTTSMIVVKKILEEINLSKEFNFIHTQEYVNKGKPSPEGYLKTAKLINTDPGMCIVFEDSKSGIAAAKAAGMYCIGILNGHNTLNELKNADETIVHFDQIHVKDLLSKPIFYN